MAKGAKQQSTVVDNSPPAFQRPYIEEMMREAQKQYQGSSPTYYPEATLAPQSQATKDAQSYLTNYAETGGRQTADNAAGAFDYLTRAARDPLSNPFYQGTLDASLRPITQNFEEVVLPNSRNRFAAAGQFGGSRAGISEGIASGRYLQTLGDVTSKMGSDAYRAGLDATAKGLALGPTAQQTAIQPGLTLDAVGQQQQQYLQSVINDARARYDYQQMLPYWKLDRYREGVSGNFGGTSRTTADVAQSGGLMAGLGGAATGGMLAGALSLSGPPGWALAGLGGLAGLTGM
jgi:hypothetical protein